MPDSNAATSPDSQTPRRVVVITGAASGIGKATAEFLANPAWQAVLLDQNPAVEEFATELKGRYASTQAIVVDLGEAAAVRQAAAQIGERYGRLDILINNAGIHPKDGGKKFPVERITLESWQHVIDVNLTAPFLLSQYALELMKREGWGRIVNIASRAGRTYIAEGAAHYSSTKAGVIGLTRLMAGEAGPFGITVNCVAPGRIVTPLSSEGAGAALHDKVKTMLPVGRVGSAIEIAAAIAYYVSEHAGFTTGTVLDVNGGGFMG